MKVTKYPQSCLVLERNGSRIAIDVGNVAMDRYAIDDLGPLDAVLFTHRHDDHCDRRAIAALRDRGVALYANADVCTVLDGAGIEIRDGEEFQAGGFDVVARDLPHVEMVDGSAGPPNTGFVIDGAFFHPGDGLEIDGLRVRHAAVPIAGPSVSFHRAYRFLKQVGAERAVPIHYDVFVADPQHFARVCDIAEVVVLAPGESTEF